MASWRKILSLRRRFQPSSSLKPPKPEARSKLNLRGDRDLGRGFARGFRLTGSTSSRLVGLVWSTRRDTGGRRGSSGAERFPCSREGNFLSLKSEPESDHSHSDEPEEIFKRSKKAFHLTQTLLMHMKTVKETIHNSRPNHYMHPNAPSRS